MSRLPMLENILGQPESHRCVLALHEGAQHPSLVACAEHIRRCEGRIVFSGMGASYFAAMPAVSRLEQRGYRVHAGESAELLHYGTSSFRGGDVGLLISRSGGSIEVLLLAESMRKAGMFVIGVTNVRGSALERAADITLIIGALADELIAVQTYTGTVLALLLLAEQVLTGDSEHLADACLAAMPVLSSFIDESLRASQSWRSLLEGNGALYLLGRGPALASVYEGALLFHETAKAPAVAMSSGQFRHGPVEVVSHAFRAVVFGTPPTTRAKDRSLAEDLVQMGATVRWIGPPANLSEDPRVAVEPLVAWPEFGPEFGPVFAPVLAPLFEVVPMQVAAYQLALWRDITPGDFRFASEITSAESGFPLLQEKRLSHL